MREGFVVASCGLYAAMAGGRENVSCCWLMRKCRRECNEALMEVRGGDL